MAPEPLWSGTIPFGRWPLDVRVYPVADTGTGRLQFVGGALAFEIEQGRYVPIEPGDLDRVELEAARAIELRDFVRPDEIAALHVRQAYYLVPQQGAEKNYRVLARALEETGRVGIASIAIRSEAHPARLRCGADGLLVLEALYREDELLRPAALEGEIDWARGPVEPSDLDAAKSLVEHFHARTAA